MEKYNVVLLKIEEKTEINSVVYADEGETSNNIILKIIFEDINITAESECYLTAYQKLRDKLLENGFGLKCNGSCINAHQSAMMSYVPEIYLVKIGKQALMKDIVSIWGYCDIDSFPDTKEQNQYIEKWFCSLKSES